jgi:UrcA family protein
MNAFIRYVVTASIVATLAGGSVVAVSATEDPYVRKVTVKFGDLNLSDSDGAATLYARIRRAAREVCGQSSDLWGSSDNCIRKAIADAVTKVNRPALFVVYNEHYKPALPAPLLARTP